MYDLFSYLSGNPYPGRGILLGLSLIHISEPTRH